LRGELPPPNMLVKALPMPGQQSSLFGMPPSLYDKLCSDGFLCVHAGGCLATARTASQACLACRPYCSIAYLEWIPSVYMLIKALPISASQACLACRHHCLVDCGVMVPDVPCFPGSPACFHDHATLLWPSVNWVAALPSLHAMFLMAGQQYSQVDGRGRGMHRHERPWSS